MDVRLRKELFGTGIALLFCVLKTADAATTWSAQDYDLYSGDFNADGLSDILYIAKSSANASGIAISDASGLNTILQSWSSNHLGIQWHSNVFTPLIGDFDRDGKSDVLMQRNLPGDSHVLIADRDGRFTSISQTIPAGHLGIGWTRDQHRLFSGNFSGEGPDDLFFQAAGPSGSHAVMLPSPSGAFTASPTQAFTDSSWGAFKWSAASSVISAGDFNGDGRADLLIQARPMVVMVGKDVLIPVPVYVPNSNGVVYSQGGSAPFQQVGVQQWSRNNNAVDWSPQVATPVVADFNGDGRDDVLLQARSAGRTSYLLMGNAAGAAFSTPTVVTTNVPITGGGSRVLAGRFGGSNTGIYIQATTPSGTNYVATALGSSTTAVVHNPAAMPGPAEIVRYSYDARGRLTNVSSAGGPNDGVQTGYTYDKANNRTSVTTTGSVNPAP